MFGITAFAQSPFAALGGNAYNQSVSESAAATDDFVGLIAYAFNVAESIAAAETQATSQNTSALINESTGPVDTPSTTLLAVGFVEDSIDQTDNYEQLTGTFVDISESISLTENYALSNSIFAATVAESQIPDDIVSSTGFIIFEDQNETISVSDTQAAITLLSAAVAESIVSLDAYTQTRDLVASITESSAVGIIVDAQLNANSDISEAVTPDDAVAATRVFDYFISESVTPEDAQAGIFNYVAEVAESMAAADNMTFTVNTRALPTGILITISVNNVNVWGNINDNSSPNWVQIND